MWNDVNSYANVFGLEPNYVRHYYHSCQGMICALTQTQPCCTVNHPQAYPKFLANSFVRTEDDGIAHVFLIPSSVSTTANGHPVHITASTNYPFSFEVQYEISTSLSFNFYVRVPNWANDESTIIGPGTLGKRKLSPSESGLHKISVPAGESISFSVNFDTQPRVVELTNNTVAVYYGALLYSLAIESEKNAGPPRRYYDETILANDTVVAETHDYAIVPTSTWNVAIDPEQIQVVHTHQAQGQELPNPIWDLGSPPVELRIAAVEIDWPIDLDTPANPPQNPKIIGNPFSARFVPYGSAKLHMANLPKLVLPKVHHSV